MIVYRLELIDSLEGLYPKAYIHDLNNSNDIFSKLINSHNKRRLSKPSIWQEIKDFKCGEDYCGCYTLSDLKHWFGEFYEELISHPMVFLRKYEVDFQCVKWENFKCVFNLIKQN